MAGSFSDDTEVAVLNAFRGTPFTVPATLYLLLSTSTINDDGTGSTEPVGNNYSRTAISMNTTTWNAPTSGAGTMTNAVALTTAVASGSWGTITDVALVSTVSGAFTMYARCTMAASVAVASGQAFNAAAGAVTVTVS